MKAHYEGLEALVEAYAKEGKTLYFLSLVGPRESVRGILAAWAKGREIRLDGEAFFSHWGGKGFMVERLARGTYHGIGYAKGLYYAREEDERRERLWASRKAEFPIPKEVWEELRPKLLLEGKGVVTLLPPSRYQVEELLRRVESRKGA